MTTETVPAKNEKVISWRTKVRQLHEDGEFDLAATREAAGLTQVELAALMNRASEQVNRWEHGKPMSKGSVAHARLVCAVVAFDLVGAATSEVARMLELFTVATTHDGRISQGQTKTPEVGW